jgi:hypothetical protein
MLSTNHTTSALPSLEQARATIWPFRSIRGQRMGDLLDRNQLSSKDLNYALLNANDPLVRQAAAILLKARTDASISRLAQRTPAKVVSGGRSFMLRKQFELFLFMGLVFGGILGAGFILTLWQIIVTLQGWGTRANQEYPLLSVILALLVMGLVATAVLWLTRLLVDRIFQAFQKRLDRYRRGQEGEDRVFEAILPMLDGQWTVFRNLTLPGRTRADLDMLLVGPAGLWLLEIKTYLGIYRNTGEKWEVHRGGCWKPAVKNPSAQAKRNAAALSSFLKADGIGAWVNPIVVWANPEAELRVEQPVTAVWTLELIHDELGKVLNSDNSKQEVARRAAEKLMRLCEDAAREREQAD